MGGERGARDWSAKDAKGSEKREKGVLRRQGDRDWATGDFRGRQLSANIAGIQPG